MSLSGDFHKRILPVQHKLYRFALRILGSVEEAEDVVQEVLLRVWRQRSEMQGWHNVEAWCMRMVKNHALDQLRSGRLRFREEMDGLPEPACCDDSPDLLAERDETLAHIHRLIAALPEKQRIALQLRDVEDYSYQEIADIMEISLDQVKVNLFRARKQLRTQLQLTESYGT